MNEISAHRTEKAKKIRADVVIEVNGLTYTYPNADEPAVCDVSFTISEAEVFGFLGPSGAGKSTTQKILIGLLDGYEGEAKVLGSEVAGHPNTFYERVGVSSEAPNHYLKLTGVENLELFASLYRGETRDPLELLDLVGLTEAADVRVGNYSKGMKSRLNFIRALLHDPDVLFLDEPTTGLDPGNAHIVKDIIRDLQDEGKTVFVTTHDMTVADHLCDRVAFMIDGEVPVIESPDSLKRQCGKPVVEVSYQRNQHLIDREFPLDDVGTDEEFAEILRSESVEAIHSKDATLEDVFLNVTGQVLE